MELLSDHMALDPNMNMGTQDSDELELPIVETQPLQIFIETSGSWDVNANSPETSTSAHGGSAKRFGFRQGEEFSCKVLIKTEFYVVYLNERLLTNSEHMVPVGSIHGLIIDGDSDIWNIAFGNPATLENFKIKGRQSATSPDSQTEEYPSNSEDVFDDINDKSNEVAMDRIKTVKSTSNLYEPDPKEEEASRELFALSEKTRKSSYQLVFDLDEEELGDKDRKDDDLRNDFRLSLVNNAKSKSIQNLFHEGPRTMAKPTTGNRKALNVNGHQIHDSMEDDELWSIDFDTLVNGVPKDYEVDQLFAFVDKIDREENEDNFDHDLKLRSAITKNDKLAESDSIPRPLTFQYDKSQEVCGPSQSSKISRLYDGSSAIPNQRKASASGIPRLDIKYFPALNQLDADACKKKLHNNTVKALRSGRRVVNGNGPAGPKQLERSFSLPMRSTPEESRQIRLDNSRIPKPMGQISCSMNSNHPQRLVNGHLNGNNDTTTASPLRRPNGNQVTQSKVGVKRSSITSLPPINNSIPKKGQSPPPKLKHNSKPLSPTKNTSTGIIRTNGTPNVKPIQMTDEEKIDPSLDKKIPIQVDKYPREEESTPQESNTTETIKSVAPNSPSLPDNAPTAPDMEIPPALTVSNLNGSTTENSGTLVMVSPVQVSEDKPNEEASEKKMIWGSVKPRETANNHFSNPTQYPYTDLPNLNGTKLSDDQILSFKADSNSPTQINGHESMVKGSNQDGFQINGGSIKESVSFQNYQSDSLKKNLASSSTVNSSIYLYDMLNGSNISQNSDMQNNPTGHASNIMHKSTASLQPTTGKKDKSTKNFLQSPRKWLSRKLSMVKKS